MPPTPNKVVLIRQDGTRIDATPEQAAKLKVLGYKEETPDDRGGRLREEAKQEYYTSGEQQVYTAVEGLGRGASLGITDYALGDDATKERARYNPGLATATEIAGAIAPELIPGLNAIAPSALVGRGARAAIKGEGLASSVARGAVEGAAFGGAAGADHAYLAGDPDTASAVLHGIGWGALFGAGASAAGSMIKARGAVNIERGAAREAEGVAIAQTAKRIEPGSFAAATEPAFVTMRTEAKRLASEIAESSKTVDAILSGNKKEMAKLGLERTMSEEAMGKLYVEAQNAYRPVAKALKGGNHAVLEKRIAEYEQVVAKIADKAGLAKTGSGGQALMEFAQTRVLQKELSKLPVSAEQFAKMSPQKAENLFASMEAAKKLSKWPTLGPSLEASANALQESMGLQAGGIEGLRGAWNAAKKQLKAEKLALRTPPPAPPPEPGIVKKAVANVAGFGAFKAASAVGHPLFGLGIGHRVKNSILNFGAPRTPELVAARNQTIGRLKQAVGKYQVKTGAAMQKITPKFASLATRLDGTQDTSTKDPSQLAYNRIQEYAMAQTHVKDTIFRAIEPIAIEQPELGPALHQEAIKAFQSIVGMFPADPGVVSGLKSIWRPSALQAAVMSRQLSVFQDPIGSAEEMLSQGIFDPIRVKALKEIAPPVFQRMRDEMIMKIQEPGFLDNMNYREQVALGSLMDIPIHSSMKPEYIAASQALHFTRNEPLPTPAMPGNTNGGRPAGDTPGATDAQITTSR